MKTQAELREMCEMMLSNIEHGDRIGTQDIEAVAADYLRLTDPTPLTAEHCRAAGMVEDDVDGHVSHWRKGPCDDLSVTFIDNDSQDIFLSDNNPTAGLLYAAQRQEETR